MLKTVNKNIRLRYVLEADTDYRRWCLLGLLVYPTFLPWDCTSETRILLHPAPQSWSYNAKLYWLPASLSQSFLGLLGLLGLQPTSSRYGLCGMELCLARSQVSRYLGTTVGSVAASIEQQVAPHHIGLILGPDSPTPSRAPPWANRHLPTHPPGCMACAGITKPSPQSGHVRRTVVPPPSLSAQVAFINNLSPARPRPREPFLCLLRTLLPVDLSVPYRHPRCFPQ